MALCLRKLLKKIAILALNKNNNHKLTVLLSCFTCLRLIFKNLNFSYYKRRCVKMKKLIFFAILFFLPLITNNSIFALPIIPSAAGWGMDTTAGSGRNKGPAGASASGEIYHVTHLGDSGPGSLRDALTGNRNGPRTVVFDVSGYIELNSDISLGEKDSYITVAGQTAPSPGIEVKNWGILLINAHDVLFQHMGIRISPGDSSKTIDALGARQPGTYNIVLDHMSVSWGHDEVIAFTHGARDFTVRYTIAAEGPQNDGGEAGHSRGWHMSRTEHAFLFGNLMLHSDTRNPRWGKTEDFNGPWYSSNAAVINNIIYNWGGGGNGGGAQIAAALPGKEQVITMTHNIFKPGQSTGDGEKGITLGGSTGGPQDGVHVFLKDNMLIDSSNPNGYVPSDPWDSAIVKQSGGTVPSNRHYTSPPTISVGPYAGEVVYPPTFDGTSFTPIPISQTLDHVLDNVGTRPLERKTTGLGNKFDIRYVNDVRNGTGRILDKVSDVGGFAAHPLVENRRTFEEPANPWGDDDGDGYTNLEEVLHSYAAAVEVGGTPPQQQGDTTSPSDPTNLSAITLSSSQINLSWNTSIDNVGVTGYKIYRDGIQINTTSNTTYQDTGLSSSTTYTYTVSAFDAAGNNSVQSNPASEITLANPSDIETPSIPLNITATTISSTRIDLTWNASTDNVGVTGYRIYRDGTQINTTSNTTYQDTGLSSFTTYTYTVSAFDAAGNESGQSDLKNVTTQSFVPFSQLFEAEDMNLISPMTIGIDFNASGGQYISPTSGTFSLSPISEATLSLTIPETGTYYLWIHMMGPDTDSDALYAGIDNIWDRVYPSASSVYQWLKVETSHKSGNYNFNLTQGTHTLQIGHGEINSRADALFLTNDPNEIPPSPNIIPDTVPPAPPTGLKFM
jgi:chitodextrinase